MVGKFEGGHLVQAILTKAVFACKKLWGDAVLGSTMNSALPSSGLGLDAPIWQPLPDALVLFACASLLSTKEEIETLHAQVPAWHLPGAIRHGSRHESLVRFAPS